MHRDLKPDNVLLGVGRDIKISDFGLARESSSNIFVTGQMGTPLYAAPEVYLHKYEEAYTDKCDVWGAGMILYEMLTQKVLFEVKVPLPHADLRRPQEAVAELRNQPAPGRVRAPPGSFSPTSCSPTTTRSGPPSTRCYKN